MTAVDPAVSQAEARGRFEYDPETGVFVDVATGKPAGRLNGSGYLMVNFGGRNVGLHRVAFMWMLGYWPASQVDHINGDRSDNRWANLRPATAAQNAQNRKASGANFGNKGVMRRPDGRWIARAQINGRTQVIPGSFESAYAAHQAYAAVVKRMSGQYARLDGDVPRNKAKPLAGEMRAQLNEMLERKASIERQLRDLNDQIRALESVCNKAESAEKRRSAARILEKAAVAEKKRRGLTKVKDPILPAYHPERR
ncbi:MAG: HNH endonuclease [Hyphomicrobiaceae bacterium]|nr:HNH endonuclease [Hyphomicrobiaceae bacterium]